MNHFVILNVSKTLFCNKQILLFAKIVVDLIVIDFCGGGVCFSILVYIRIRLFYYTINIFSILILFALIKRIF